MVNNCFHFFRNGAFLLAGTLWLALAFSACGETTAFEKGVAAYGARNFAAAAKYFGDEINHAPSAEAWRNLGNAEWQNEHAGPAILAWERARWMNTEDADAAASLHFARQSAQLDELPLRWWEIFSTWLPPNTWAWLAAGSFWLTVSLVFVFPVILGWRKSAWTQSLAAIAFGVFLLAITGAVGIRTRMAIAVVVSPAAPLRQTPTQHAQILAHLAAGEEARCRSIRGNYYCLRTSSSDWGWVEKNQLEFISGPNSIRTNRDLSAPWFKPRIVP